MIPTACQAYVAPAKPFDVRHVQLLKNHRSAAIGPSIPAEWMKVRIASSFSIRKIDLNSKRHGWAWIRVDLTPTLFDKTSIQRDGKVPDLPDHNSTTRTERTRIWYSVQRWPENWNVDLRRLVVLCGETVSLRIVSSNGTEQLEISCAEADLEAHRSFILRAAADESLRSEIEKNADAGICKIVDALISRASTKS